MAGAAALATAGLLGGCAAGGKGRGGAGGFTAAMPRNTKRAEPPSHGLPVIFYDPDSRGAIAYTQLARELKARNRAKAKG